MTIKDIAKQCSVSVSTVSRVLNDRPDVSEDVRRKVLSAIKNSNYIPNNSARDLVRTKSDAVGLVVRGVSNPFYTDIIRAIERTITDAGFTMVMQQIGTCDDEVKCGAVMERESACRASCSWAVGLITPRRSGDAERSLCVLFLLQPLWHADRGRVFLCIHRRR